MLVYRTELVSFTEMNVYPNGFIDVEENNFRPLKSIGHGYYNTEWIGDIVVTKDNISEFIEKDGTFWYWDNSSKSPLRAKYGDTSNPIKKAINSI